MYDHYFSNFGRPSVSNDICKGSAIRHPRFWRTRCLKVFPIQIHREANLTLPLKGQMSIYNICFSNSGRPPVPDDMQRFSPKASSVLEKKIFKGFYHIWQCGHLGEWTATILAIFRSPNLRRLHMKFEQNWLRGFRGEVV